MIGLEGLVLPPVVIVTRLPLPTLVLDKGVPLLITSAFGRSIQPHIDGTASLTVKPICVQVGAMIGKNVCADGAGLAPWINVELYPTPLSIVNAGQMPSLSRPWNVLLVMFVVPSPLNGPRVSGV